MQSDRDDLRGPPNEPLLIGLEKRGGGVTRPRRGSRNKGRRRTAGTSGRRIGFGGQQGQIGGD